MGYPLIMHPLRDPAAHSPRSPRYQAYGAGVRPMSHADPMSRNQRSPRSLPGGFSAYHANGVNHGHHPASTSAMEPSRRQRLPSLHSILSSPTTESVTKHYDYTQRPPEPPKYVNRHTEHEPAPRHEQVNGLTHHQPAPGPPGPPPAPHRLPPLSDQTNPPPMYAFHQPGLPGPPAPMPPRSPPSHRMNVQPPNPAQYHHPPPPRAPAGPVLGHPEAEPSQRQPKVIGTRNIDGFGECYIYDNGHFVQCSIAGEPVNPNWGVTKAGKPRKRLAQACMACREKKIRCPLKPGQSKCDHCVKNNRTCEISTAQRSSPEPESMDMTPTSIDGNRNGLRRSPYGKLESVPPIVRKRSAESFQPHKIITDNHTTPPDRVESSHSALKRRKSYGSNFMPTPVGSNPDVTPPLMYSPREGSPVDTSMLDLDTDPFLHDPQTVERLLGYYYSHRGCVPYHVFPPDKFREWAINGKKTRIDRMVLYSVLALGARFSPRMDERKNLSHRLAKISQQACRDKWTASHQLAHTRIYLALWHFSRGDNPTCWEYLTAAHSTLSALNFNTEEGVHEMEEADDDLFGLSKIQLVECRRRTFWVGYAIDRYIGFAGGHMATWNENDILLRLPQHQLDYWRGLASDMPFFHELNSPTIDRSLLSDMSILLLNVSIWSEATAYMYRARYMPSREKYEDAYMIQQKHMEDRLEHWRSLLPQDMQFNTKNTKAAIENGRFGLYYLMHCIALVTSMKMHRFGRYQLLPEKVVKAHIRRAHCDARNILKLVTAMAKATVKDEFSDDLHFALAQPFPGYSVLAACDVLSVGGQGSESMQQATVELGDASYLLEQLGRFWYTADRQHLKVRQRLTKMSAMTLSDHHDETKFWRIHTPIEESFLGRENDLIYGSPESLLQEALTAP